jgi:UDP-glucose 4-epimerase
MIKDLLRANYEVLTLDDLSKGHRDLVCGGTFIKGGVGDAALLEEIFSIYPIDAVMHFAAYSIVGESVENPLDYYRNNVAATAELLSSMAGQIRPEANTQILSHLINNRQS